MSAAGCRMRAASATRGGSKATRARSSAPSVIARRAIAALAFVVGPAPIAHAQLLDESFDNGVPPTWQVLNRSNAAGPTSWFAGNPAIFAAQSGAASSYVAANFNATKDAGTISAWLLTPQLASLANGTRLTFYTRTEASSPAADALEARLCLGDAAPCADVGADETSVGSYTTLLTAINPGLLPSGYPGEWTMYRVALSGLPPGANPGRIAFRYAVGNGGPLGANSNYVAVDTVRLAALNAAADLVVATSHTGDLVAGRETELIATVSNVGTAPSAGTITVVEMLSPGLVANDIRGDGWSCTLATLTCSRSDALAPGTAYAPIVVTAIVSATAPPVVTHSASITGGGDSNDSNNAGSDTIPVAPAGEATSIPALDRASIIVLGLMLVLAAALLASRRR